MQRLEVKKELSFADMAQDAIPRDALQAERQPTLDSMTSWQAFVSRLDTEDELSMLERGLHSGCAQASVQVRPVAKGKPKSYACMQAICVSSTTIYT